MKKFIALLSASVLLCSMVVSAAPSPSTEAVVSSQGFTNNADYKAAADRGLSAGEYYNNAVVSTPGVAKATPIAQGGKIVINGVVTNLTATLSKVNKNVASTANAQAEALGGSLLNVLKVDFPGAKYNVATINFYLKGLEAGKKVAVRQFIDGEWVDVEVVEVRADHVILNLTNSGVIAFVEIP